MENKIRVYKPNRYVEEKLNIIISLIEELKNDFGCELAFDNTYTNHYRIYYNTELFWEFGTYPEIIRALTLVKTILKDKKGEI